jgi:hypothetical protein
MAVDNGYVGDLPVYKKLGWTRAEPSDILLHQKDLSVLLPLSMSLYPCSSSMMIHHQKLHELLINAFVEMTKFHHCFLKPNPWTSCIGHIQNAMAWGNISTWNHNGWFVRCGFTLEKKEESDALEPPTLVTCWIWLSYWPELITQWPNNNPTATTLFPTHLGTCTDIMVVLYHPISWAHSPHPHRGCIGCISWILQIRWQYKSHHTTSCHTNIWCRISLVGHIETEE